MAMVLALDSPIAPLEQVGGKALNLMRLTRAGFTVPPGVVVTTAAYRAFVAANQLSPIIATGEPEKIRTAFTKGVLPEPVRAEVSDALSGWDGVPLAVRSSATAEDLPQLSFAGQQESYLNVIGLDQVLIRVIECWASLFTDRAVSYRRTAEMPEEDLALAVVVQRLVLPPEGGTLVSGVLFTANPVTGVRDEASIEATFGLGEALVSGQVEPDHYLLDKRTGRLLSSQPGSKRIGTQAVPGGGVETVEFAEESAALSTRQLQALCQLARDLETEYQSPQDAEWVFTGNELIVVQARAITTLFEIPRPLGSAVPARRGAREEFSVWLSFGAVQGVVGPITPLGRDAIGYVASGAAGMVGADTRREHLWFVGEAGDRLWIRIDSALRHPIGRRLLPRLIGLAEPGSSATLRGLLVDPRLSARPAKAGSLRGLLRLARRVVPNLIATQARPESGRRRFDATAARVVGTARTQLALAEPGDDDATAMVTRRATAAQASLRSVLRVMFPVFVPIMGPSVLQLAALNRLLADAPERDRQLHLGLLRGLAGNVTTEMDLALWRVAETIRDTGHDAAVLIADPAALAREYLRGELAQPIEGAVSAFLDRYGMRGVGEIDLGRPRWRDDPTPVFATLRSYLALTDAKQAPDVQYARALDAADLALERLPVVLAGGPFGLIRSGFARWASRRIRILLGARETPKFTIVQVMGLIRAGLLDSGKALATEGLLEKPTDISFLTLDELAHPETRSRWRTLVLERAANFRREQRRRAVPRLICGDGHAYYGDDAANVSGAAIMSGAGVSPGTVEARVRVVDDPHTSELQPGEVLVCAGTDPAWTPLFLAAGGLVTEVGGMMTHGSVVAREYGIPAVVGVFEATTRLQTGALVRLDGSAGTITVLSEIPHATTADVTISLSTSSEPNQGEASI